MVQQDISDLTREAAAATKPADLGLLLRQLLRREARQRRDTPWTYRELAAKTGWSLGSISRYLDGKVVPPTDRFDALVRLLGATATEQGALATARDRVAEERRRWPASLLPAPVPRQLPRDATWFTGRSTELELLLAAALDSHQKSSGSAVVISAIDGMAGVGKTALAVHVAHRLTEQYPDGQLFLDLHGFTKGVAPVEPADALDRLARDVGVPSERIPAGLDERAALWRSVLAGRRMLIVLDNAATEAQVQPLLPGAAGCLVLVTSRRRLTALEAGYTMSLDTLPIADAVKLFVNTADRPDLSIDPSEVRESMELCGRLPLAIRIVAARLKHRRVWTVADLVQRLRDLDVRLAMLDDGQRSVHAALHLSYGNLSGDAQRLYRLLGLHPGSDIDPYAATALADGRLDEVQRLLDGLVDDHLMAEPTRGRYRFHDLIRAHAAGLLTNEESQAQQRAALERLLDYYGHTVASATDVAYPHERPRLPKMTAAGTPTPDLNDRNQAVLWLDTEVPNLLAAVQLASQAGLPAYTWQLSAILDRHLRTRGRYSDAETLHQHALDLARAHDNHAAEMDAMNGLGYVHRMQGHHELAGVRHGRALQIAVDLGDRVGELQALIGLGNVHRMHGRHEQAAEHYRRALETAQAIGDRVGERTALGGLGNVHWMLDRYEQAGDCFGQALRVAQDIGDRNGEWSSLIGLGYVDRTLGRYQQAGDYFGQALRIAQTIGDRRGEMNVLAGLGHIDRMLGRYEQAGDYFGRALRIARTIGDRGGEVNVLTGLGHVHRMLDHRSEAAECYKQVLDLARQLGRGNWEYEGLQGLGRLNHAIGSFDLALTHHQQALLVATDLAQPSDQARAHDGIAHVHHAMGRYEQARRHWQSALDILTSLGTDHTQDNEASVASIRTRINELDQGSET